MLIQKRIVLLILLTLFTALFNIKNSDCSSKNRKFSDNNNGTIFEPSKNLMWQKVDDRKTRTWEEAEQYCSDLVLADYDDWRLPDKDELFDLVLLKKKEAPKINPVFKCRQGTYWTGDKSKVAQAAWIVDFRFGLLQVYHTDYPRYYVRCVRNTVTSSVPDSEK